MSEEKLTYDELRDEIISDGLHYCITDGISSERMPDEKLSKLWSNAAGAHRAVDEYLKSKLGEDYKWE